ncbi:biotin-dependent carboxyltransferase family protein [Pseudooceanicola sp. C21-150M6]|uniref:5-oxoprolinase subunit C family protein n=1 Tax=Pseudooceanicola sp. C21-150M6 TaxID=3434355 RepID=UPI003D7FEA91
MPRRAMTGQLVIRQAGPGLSVQDAGRPDMTGIGLSRGGAADRLALAEGAALLRQAQPGAALEMAGMGGRFEVTQPTRIALTGAPMTARIGDRSVSWNASHRLEPGEVLTIGAATAGIYGYLSFPGGIVTDPVLGSRSTHLAGGVGRLITDGDRLPVGPDPDVALPGYVLPPSSRFEGGTVRYVYGPQTGLFSAAEVSRFEATEFFRDRSGNRQGVRLKMEVPPFVSEAPENLASEFIFEGDIQMTGAGVPYVLLAECQTMGGYPRIGTVVPDDLPLIAQARPDMRLTFRRLPSEELATASTPLTGLIAQARRLIRPLVRDPRHMPDLLSYSLISGVTAGDDLDRT